MSWRMYRYSNYVQNSQYHRETHCQCHLVDSHLYLHTLAIHMSRNASRTSGVQHKLHEASADLSHAVMVGGLRGVEWARIASCLAKLDRQAVDLARAAGLAVVPSEGVIVASTRGRVQVHAGKRGVVNISSIVHGAGHVGGDELLSANVASGEILLVLRVGWICSGVATLAIVSFVGKVLGGVGALVIIITPGVEDIASI